jgi:hypothetical protein
MSRRLSVQGYPQVHRRDLSKNPTACGPCGQPSHLTRNTGAAACRNARRVCSSECPFFATFGASSIASSGPRLPRPTQLIKWRAFRVLGQSLACYLSH